MTDAECIELLQWALPRLGFRWRGFRKVRRQVRRRIQRRLGQLGLSGAGAYRDYLRSHPAEWQVLDGCCRITVSRFYRDRAVFDHLGQKVLPELAATAIRHGQSEIRCWSAGCASGEEVYTVAILAATGPLAKTAGVRLRMVATDADQHVLERARRARYPASSVKDVPAGWLTGPLAPSGDEHVVRSDLRHDVEFHCQDIRREWPDGPFHLVLCRNLAFTYFDQPLQRSVLRRMIERILPGGVLVIGKQESLPETPSQIIPWGRNLGTYRVSPSETTADRLDGFRHR